MSPWLTPEVIVSIATLLTAIIGFATIMIKQDRQHALTNSRMDELLVSTGKASRAEGNIEGRAEARAIDGNENQKAIAAIETVAEAITAPKELVGEITGKVAEKSGEHKPIKGAIKGKIVTAKKK